MYIGKLVFCFLSSEYSQQLCVLVMTFRSHDCLSLACRLSVKVTDSAVRDEITQIKRAKFACQSSQHIACQPLLWLTHCNITEASLLASLWEISPVFKGPTLKNEHHYIIRTINDDTWNDVSEHECLHSFDAHTPDEIHEVSCVNSYGLHSF